MNALYSWLTNTKPTDWISIAIALTALCFSILSYLRAKRADQIARETQKGENRRKYYELVQELAYLSTQVDMSIDRAERWQQSANDLLSRIPPHVANLPAISSIINDMLQPRYPEAQKERDDAKRTVDLMWSAPDASPEMFSLAHNLIAAQKGILLKMDCIYCCLCHPGSCTFARGAESGAY